jgi:hypothetical protein
MTEKQAGMDEFGSFERIKATDHFADRVMERIAIQKAGGMRAMTASSRILIFALVVVVYSSLGVFIGLQSYKSFGPDNSSKRKQALIEFRNTHHLNPVEGYDQIFRPFLSSK